VAPIVDTVGAVFFGSSAITLFLVAADIAAEDEERLGTVLAMGVRVQTAYRSLPTFCGNRVDRVVVAARDSVSGFCGETIEASLGP